MADDGALLARRIELVGQLKAMRGAGLWLGMVGVDASQPYTLGKTWAKAGERDPVSRRAELHYYLGLALAPLLALDDTAFFPALSSLLDELDLWARGNFTARYPLYRGLGLLYTPAIPFDLHYDAVTMGLLGVLESVFRRCSAQLGGQRATVQKLEQVLRAHVWSAVFRDYGEMSRATARSALRGLDAAWIDA